MNRSAAAYSVLVAISLVLVPGPVSAQGGLADGLRAILDTNYSFITTTTTDASGDVTTKTNTVYPQLILNTDTFLYPSLRLAAGGVFDVTLTSFGTTRAGDTNLTSSRLRPFLELRSTNPIFSPGVAYYRRESRTRTAGSPAQDLVGEDYAGYLGWRPEGLPRSDFQFLRTNTFDTARAIQDVTQDFGSLTSRHSYRGLTLTYLGSYLGTNDKKHSLQTRQWTNSGRLTESESFFRKRLNWNTTYNINRQDLTSAARGEGAEVALPLIPFAGLAALSDTPITTALSQNPLLIDGNRTASAGINIGVPAVGADTQARNMGLDLSTSTEVNRLLVWIDRDLPAGVASSFSWELYTSTDNVTWTRQATVSPAPFGPFENRFQIDFSSIAARYVKVVTRPLSGAVLESSRFPDIFVTELQAFLRRPASSADARVGRTSHVLNTDVRLRMLDKPALFYEGSYWYAGAARAGEHRDTLSNGVSVYHTFARIFNVYGRGAREQGLEAQGPRVATVENATLTVSPIRTFTGSLLYTALDERIAGRPDDRRSLFIQTNTQLYRGVDFQFGGGWTFTTAVTGQRSRDGLLNVSASVVPRPNVMVTATYADTTTRRLDVLFDSPAFRTRRGYLTVLLDPLRTLHLALGEELIASTGERTRVTHNIGANWLPFPDGSLQFSFAYNEALRDVRFGTERILRPGVRWTFSRQSYVDVSYQRIESEFVFQKAKSKVFGVDLKFFL